MSSKNKDRKAKKREADAKLRQHAAAGAEEVWADPAALASLPANAAELLAESSNKKDAAALYFINAQKAKAAQRAQLEAYNRMGQERDAEAAQQQQQRRGDGDDDDADEDENTVVHRRTVGNKDARAETAEGNTDQTAAAGGRSGGQPKRRRFSQESLKLALPKALGAVKGARLIASVDEHTGSAPEPFVCAQLRGIGAYVSVPRHWESVRSYLSLQTNRPAANVVLPEVKASAVESVRLGRNAKPDVRNFAKAFLSSDPMGVKTYNLRLMGKGEQYEGRRWRPSTTITPGVISDTLRRALGMLTHNSPTPWIHAMQRIGSLPPSYPNATFAGLNGPLPEGGRWGEGVGQWGAPVRKSDGTFKFPAVQSLGNTTTAAEAAAAAASSKEVDAALIPFGTVPPRRRDGIDADDTDNAAPSAPVVPSTPAALRPPTAVAPMPTSAAAVAAAALAAARATTAAAPTQMDEYLVTMAANDDDLLSAGVRLVKGHQQAAGTRGLGLAPTFGY